MEKQPIARNNRLDNKRFERGLENKISRQSKSSEFETTRTRIQLFDVLRFHSDAIRS